MSTFERAAEAPLVAPTASNPASRVGEVLGVVASDVLGGLRHASHHVLAAVGLVAVVVVGFLAGRPDLRHGLEDHALSWLSARAIQRAEGGVDAAPDILLAMADTFRGAEGAARFELLMDRLADQVRIFATQVAADGNNSMSLDRWAAAWERLSSWPAEAEAVNLDRADVFWSVISDLRAAAKTAM